MDRGSFLRGSRATLSAQAACEPRPEKPNEPFEEKRRDGVPVEGTPKAESLACVRDWQKAGETGGWWVRTRRPTGIPKKQAGLKPSKSRI